jgi:hypothetical protein
MVTDIGESQAGRDPGGAGQRGAQRGLADAVAVPGREHAAGPVDLQVLEVSALVSHVADEVVDRPGGLRTTISVAAQLAC